MAKRFRLGLNYFFDNKTNSGIVNYIFNIISALKTLSDSDCPDIIVFYSINAPIDYLKTIHYSRIKFILFKPYPNNILIRKGNTFINLVLGIDLYKSFKYLNKIDCLFPYIDFIDFHFKTTKNKIHWLVDFNNKAFPEFYEDEGRSMNLYQEKISQIKEKVVLSSQALLDELKVYYPNYTCDIRILRFASSLRIPIDETLLIDSNLLPNVPYFMSPNQFWEHKNQSVLLEAIGLIRRENPNLQFKVLFTGSLEVNRGKGLYISKLQGLVKELGIESYIQFLGVIDRDIQILLMKKAISLIQPSLYEGWSTLVEESKALNQYIILSNIPVHKEQIKKNASFFNPQNPKELARLMIEQLLNPIRVEHLDYTINIKNYAKDLIHVFTS